MSTELSADKLTIIEQWIAVGRFVDYRQALDHAVELLRDETESLNALNDNHEGLASMRRGEGTPLEEAVDPLRSKFEIPLEWIRPDPRICPATRITGGA